MSKILRDVERIIVLAKKVHIHLTKNKIRTARREIKRIINLDIDELTRLQNKHGDKKVIEECGIVLKDAKNALRSIEIDNNSEEARKIIDEVINLEGAEMIEVTKEEEKINLIYSYWKNTVRNKKFYHGTSSLSVPQIEKYGLSPVVRPAYWTHIKRLYQLYKKAGISNPLHLVHFDFEIGMTEFVNKGTFITPSYSSAKIYARQSPAIWKEFIGELNQRDARRKFLLEPFFQGEIERKRKTEEIYESNPKQFYENILSYYVKSEGLPREKVCLLSKEELYEIKKIFEVLWITFKEVKPVVIHISVLASAIAEEEPFTETSTKKSAIYDFDAFVEFFNIFSGNGTFEKGKAEIEDKVFDPVGYQIVIKNNVPKKYIKIEYL